MFGDRIPRIVPHSPGSTEPPRDIGEWQPARVILAEITKEIYGLVVCPVLECGLAAHPVRPSCEMLIPETGSTFVLDEDEKRVGWAADSRTVFYLKFDDMLEFWEFGSTVAHLRSDEEIRKADLLYKLSLVRLFVPSHGPGGLMDAICTNVDHAPADGDQSPSSSSSESSSITISGD
ncbi:hypothetical protein GSI_05718 [Ganoderma sinense ZZ0214-1]|uniref:Uncharacterized protein n=1 Tax=Ganoderma sinense ZZ0214-1 TaxID=1077348 RepID=A0A2G8SB80_9APHY|nr:hypothetical protein GSI_05718 [Ganoderma sinense ZZ0214-1]